MGGTRLFHVLITKIVILVLGFGVERDSCSHAVADLSLLIGITIGLLGV